MQAYRIMLNFSYHSLPCKSHAIHQSFFRNGKTCLLKHYNALYFVSNSELKHCLKNKISMSIKPYGSREWNAFILFSKSRWFWFSYIANSYFEYPRQESFNEERFYARFYISRNLSIWIEPLKPFHLRIIKFMIIFHTDKSEIISFLGSLISKPE